MGSLGTLGSLNVLLSADTAQFSSAMEKAAYTADKNLQRIAFKGKVTVAAITTAIIASGTAIAVSVKNAIDHADKISEMAQAVGLTAEQLSSLEYAAKLSGLGIDDLGTSFRKFNKAIFDGANGVQASEAAFKSLGITITDNNGNIKNNYELFLESADALSKLSDGAQKSAMAQTLFGKSGATMIPILNEGKTGIQRLADEAAKYGVVLSSSTAAAADRFNDNMKRIASVSQGLINSFTSGLVPALADMTDNISGSASALEKFKIAGESVAGVIITIANTGMTLAQSVSSLIDTISTGSNQLYLLTTMQLKEAGNAGDEYAKRQSKSWTDLAATLQKNWDAMNNTGQVGAAKTRKNLEDISDSTNTFNKNQEEGLKLTDSLRTSQEKYDEEMERYKELLDAGAISQDTFERAATKSKDTLEKSSQATNKMKDAARDLGFTFQSAFEDAIINGKKFSEVLKSLLQDIERIVLRKAITEPIANIISSGLSSFMGSFSKTSTPTPAAKSAHGNIFSGGNLIPFASGGLITRPSLFPMANGGVGLAGEAGTEAIMPLFRGSNGDLGVKGGRGGGVEINVYAPAGSKVSQSQKTSGDKEQINIMIDEAVAGSVKDSGSKTHRALKNSFGLRQSLTTR